MREREREMEGGWRGERGSECERWIKKEKRRLNGIESDR